jgi:hypothetical protein
MVRNNYSPITVDEQYCQSDHLEYFRRNYTRYTRHHRNYAQACRTNCQVCSNGLQIITLSYINRLSVHNYPQILNVGNCEIWEM